MLLISYAQNVDNLVDNIVDGFMLCLEDVQKFLVMIG